MLYYIKSENGKTGPFDINELASQSITKDTLIWYDGLFGWTKAGELLELLDIVSESPRPVKKSVAELLAEMRQNNMVPFQPEMVIHLPRKHPARTVLIAFSILATLAFALLVILTR